MGAIKGNKIVYLYRLLADAKTMAAMALAFQTENGRQVLNCLPTPQIMQRFLLTLQSKERAKTAM